MPTSRGSSARYALGNAWATLPPSEPTAPHDGANGVGLCRMFGRMGRTEVATSSQVVNLIAQLVKLGVLLNLTKCVECKRSGTTELAGWIISTQLMIPVWAKCPECQSDEERAEAVIREATGPKLKLQGIFVIPDNQQPEI